MGSRTEGEQRESPIIQLEQKFHLFGLEPQTYKPKDISQTFKSRLTLQTGVIPDLDFIVSLGNPFRAVTQMTRRNQLYVVSDLRKLGKGMIARHDISSAGVRDAPRYSYTLNPEVHALLNRMRLKVYDEEKNIYEAQPDKDELSEWGKLQFSETFSKIYPPTEGKKGHFSLIYHVEDREELRLAEAEFLLSSMEREKELGSSRYNFSGELRENYILFAAGGDSEKVREIEETLKKDPFYWEVVMRVSPVSLSSSMPDLFGPRREFIEPDDPAVEMGILRRSQGNDEKAIFFRSIANQEHLFREFYPPSQKTTTLVVDECDSLLRRMSPVGNLGG